MIRTRGLLGIIGIAALACGGSAGNRDGVTVWDSAGILVVENHTPEWTEDNGWHVTAEPLVTIGGSDDLEQQLYQVDAAIRLDDGRIVVANAGSHQLKFFGPDGTWLFNRGGEGSGPGEFHDITGFTRFGTDSLVVFDRREMRRTVFSSDGELGSIAPVGDGRLIFPTGVMSDGTIIGTVGYTPSPSVEDQAQRDTFAVVRVNAGGTNIDTIMMLRGLEFYRHGTGGGALPFARSTRTVTRGISIFAADTEKYEIHRHDGFGALGGILRRPHELRSVRPAELEAYKEQRLADLPPTFLEMMGPAIEAAPAPPTMPALGDLVIDADGNLWVEEYRSPLDEGPVAWSVFNGEGRWLGDVEVPEGLTVYDIGDDFILGLERDELDVEYVVLYGLSKST